MEKLINNYKTSKDYNKLVEFLKNGDTVIGTVEISHVEESRYKQITVVEKKLVMIYGYLESKFESFKLILMIGDEENSIYEDIVNCEMTENRFSTFMETCKDYNLEYIIPNKQDNENKED